MDWSLIIAGVLCAWAVLRIVGGERQRRMQDLAVTVRAALEAAGADEPAALPPGRGVAVRSKVGR